MSENTVLFEVRDRVATIILNRPQQLNALDEQTRLALLDALRASEADRDVGAIVLTGGGRAFCVGQDLAATQELDDCDDCVARTYNPVAQKLATIPKPVIAAVNGPAVGAGMGFALSCDMVLMAQTSFYACSFAKVGLVPDSGASFHLARILGFYRAFEIATSGRRIAADEAVALGIANRAVLAESLLDDAQALARALAAGPPKAIALTKRLLREAQSASFEDALSAEAMAQGVAGASPDHAHLRAAFLEKTKR